MQQLGAAEQRCARERQSAEVLVVRAALQAAGWMKFEARALEICMRL